MFSRAASRLHNETNPLYRVRDELKQQGHQILDFISGNINEYGIVFPQELLQEILLGAAPQCAIYRPDSLGQFAARRAIAGYYGEAGIEIAPEAVVITPGTSISYWYCFKLLADEGEEVLCPRPSYPLFDYIALLSGVKMIPYPMDETRGWSIDIERTEACLSTRTKALILISPHNPTGHVSTAEEIEALVELAVRHGLAIISDEVFSEFLLESNSLPRPAANGSALVFTLNGFSKMLALPGMKLGWMAVTGPSEKVRLALRALELISDTFLPVNEIAQAAAPLILRDGRDFIRKEQIQIRQRWQITEEALSKSDSVSYHRPLGGFYVTLHLGELDEERAAEALLRDERILAHPGYFYDMRSNHIVLSFVQRPEVLREALPRMVSKLGPMGSLGNYDR